MNEITISPETGITIKGTAAVAITGMAILGLIAVVYLES